MTIALLSRLELETRPYHADADGIWRDLLAADITVGAYMQLLVRVYGFEAPIESALAYTPEIGRLIDLRARVRSGLIAGDLLALQLTAAQIALLPQSPIGPFADAAEALGWIYVRERATLLHDTVRRRVIAAAPALAPAVAYLTASDAARWARWAELVDVLDRHGRSVAVQGRVLAGARDAFRRALDWFHGHEPVQARGA